VPRDSQERTMQGLALQLKDMPRTQARPRTKAGWWPRFLAAAVMLALMLGLFALLALTRNPRAPQPAPETGTSLAGSNHSDPRGNNGTKDEKDPAPAAQADPPLTEADLPKLIHDIETGNPSERRRCERHQAADERPAADAAGP